MIGVWCAHFFEHSKIINFNDLASLNVPRKKISLVEFGPGRGTLMIDIIRVFQMLKILNGVEINFIEFSPFMRKMQQNNILKQLQKYDIWMKYEYEESKRSKVERFTSENKDFYLSLRWFSMYENMLYEDFGNDKMIKIDFKEKNICKHLFVLSSFLNIK